MVDVGGVLARLMPRLTCLAMGEVYWDQTFLTQSVRILQALRGFPFMMSTLVFPLVICM